MFTPVLQAKLMQANTFSTKLEHSYTRRSDSSARLVLILDLFEPAASLDCPTIPCGWIFHQTYGYYCSLFNLNGTTRVLFI
jgi:hypothetical protein